MRGQEGGISALAEGFFDLINACARQIRQIRELDDKIK